MVVHARLKMSKNVITVLGAGTWGTAIASVLAISSANEVKVWTPTGRNLSFLRKQIHPNLKDFIVPAQLFFTDDLQDALIDSSIVIFAVSSEHLSEVVERCASCVSEKQVLISLVKGLDCETLKVPSQIISEAFPKNKLVVLTGPSHAEEVILLKPFGLQMASHCNDAMDLVARLFSHIPVYLPRTDDVLGAELGGALKNILAIGYGVSMGLSIGANFNALLATIGLEEIKRIIIAQGGKADTVLSLCCFGDLLTTIGSPHSRNRLFGELLGQGFDSNTAKFKVGMAVEGVNAIKGALKIAKQHDVHVPIIILIDDIMEGKRKLADFPDVIQDLKKFQ